MTSSALGVGPFLQSPGHTCATASARLSRPFLADEEALTRRRFMHSAPRPAPPRGWAVAPNAPPCTPLARRVPCDPRYCPLPPPHPFPSLPRWTEYRLIGKKGEDIEKLRVEVAGLLGMVLPDVRLNIAEIRKPELDALLVAEGIAQQLERRVQFRRAMRRAVTNSMRIGAGGIKVKVAGRLNGAEIARSEWYREGRVPLHTLRADIDYGLAEAHTTYGIIGVKVWIFHGEIFDMSEAGKDSQDASGAAAG